MVVEELTDQWICSCGNWVDQAFDWCPDCCDSKMPKRRRRRKPRRVRIRGSLTGLKVGEPSFLALLYPAMACGVMPRRGGSAVGHGCRCGNTTLGREPDRR